MPEPVKPTRPMVLGGVSVKVVTGCGNMYVQLNWYRGKLFEIFATLGKGGGCAVCQSEALTRGVTLGIKYGVPLGDYIHQLRGIRCPTPMPFPKEQAVLSCPDALAKVLERYGSLSIEQVIALVREPNGGADKGLASVTSEQAEAVAQMKELARVREEQGLNG